MIPCPQPPCSSCGSTVATYQSDKHNLILCYQCIRVFSEWMGRRGLIEPCVFVQELFIPALGYDTGWGTYVFYIEGVRQELDWIESVDNFSDS